MDGKKSLEIFRFTQRKPTLAICSAGSTQVESVQIITDRDTGRSKGYAFVQMTDDDAAEKAIAQLNGKEIGGRNLTVNEARLMEKRDLKARGGGRGRRRY
jgi:RNA recognition motif-containing protein